MQDSRNEALIEYLSGCARQDAKALDRLYRATSAHLYAQLLRILRHEASAQDCLQQVYIRVWAAAGQYDAGRARPMTWLGTMTRNIAIDWIRRQRPSEHDSDELIAAMPGRSDIEADVDLAQHSGALHQCLAELNDDQRRALELAYFEGLTHQDLANQLDQPLGTVKSWVRRGLERLKTCMSHLI